MTPPVRTDNGYRSYTAKHIEELTLLRQARQVGFTLDECRELLALFHNPARHSADVKAATLLKVAEIEQHINDLNQMRMRLLALAEECPGMRAQIAQLLIAWRDVATQAVRYH